MTDPADGAAQLARFAQFAAELRDERARRPGRSALFPQLGPPAMRRQIVRWLGAEPDEATAGTLETLRAALGDTDWEVRASAIVIGARLGAARLRAAVREADLPSANQHGLSERDARRLLALRTLADAAVDSPPHDGERREQAVLARFPDAPSHLVRVLLGLPTDQRDESWRLVYSLGTPLALDDALPDPLPEGLVRRDRRCWLAGTTVEMCWVSPQPHVLGRAPDDEHGAGDEPNPLREHTPARGLFIARRPLTAEQVRASGAAPPVHDTSLDPATAARLARTPEAPLVASYADAAELCAALSRALGVALRLPSADELECAARGTDGRRYAWGNGIERLDGSERSPHGLERFALPIAQWTSSLDALGRPLVLGGPDGARCDERRFSLGAAAVRPVVRVGGA